MEVRVNEEVKKALSEGKPVVALESTIISHGMPYPQNVETALHVEEIVRENGGVHRGAENTMDISADLEELARTNVTVICAGAKAILDLPKTLEVLETKGVPVLGYQTEELPAFYTRESGLKVDYCLKDAKNAADIIKAKRELGLDGGVLIVNPIPEEYSYPSEEINAVIDEALKEMDEKGIKGKECTPFLLAKVAEKTSGKSLEANIKLVYNNAKVGTQIAKEYYGK